MLGLKQPVNAAPAARPDPAAVRILAAHDDPAVLARISEALQSAGYTVLTAMDPMAALEILEAETPSVLITRVDFGAGKLNGVAMARMAQFKRNAAGTVFVVSRNWGSATAELGEALSLPLDRKALLDAVGRVIGRRARGPASR